MRAGRLKTKRYKVRRRGGRGVVALLLAALLLAGAAYMVKEKQIPVFAAPSPTLTPAESRQETRTITLPAATWYALQLGVFEQESAAKSLAESYQGRGAAGYIDDGEHYRVLAAAYETRADAQAVALLARLPKRAQRVDLDQALDGLQQLLVARHVRVVGEDDARRGAVHALRADAAQLGEVVLEVGLLGRQVAHGTADETHAPRNPVRELAFEQRRSRRME